MAEPEREAVLGTILHACGFVEDLAALGGTAVFLEHGGDAARRCGQSYLPGGDLSKALLGAPATPDRLERLTRLATKWKVSHLLAPCAYWSSRVPEYWSRMLPEQPDLAIILLSRPYDASAAREHGIPCIATQEPGLEDENVDFALPVRASRDYEMANLIADAICSAILWGRYSIAAENDDVRPLSAEELLLSEGDVESLKARLDDLRSAVDVEELETDWLGS